MESVKIVVRFQIVNTLKHGEMMAVIGNCPELGNWDTSKSIGLWWQEGNLWRGSTYFRSVPKEIEYKYIIVNYENGNIVWNSDITRKHTFQLKSDHAIVTLVDHVQYPQLSNVTVVDIPTNSNKRGIIVLGKRLLDNGKPSEMLVNRVNEACKLYQSIKDSADVKLILTGGKVQKNADSEAAVMRKLCLNNGIPDSQILPEPYAMSTIYNALNSRDILEDQGITNVIIVTSDFHMKRSKKLFDLVLGKEYTIGTHEDHPKLSEKELVKEQKVEVQMLATIEARLNVYLRFQ